MLRHGYFIKPDIQLCLLIADVVQTYIYLGNRINNDAYKNDINEIVIDIDIICNGLRSHADGAECYIWMTAD